MADNQNGNSPEELPGWTEYAESTEDIWSSLMKAPLVDKGPGGIVSIEKAAEKFGLPAGKVARATAEKAKAASNGLTVLGIGASGLKAYNSINKIVDVWGDPEASHSGKILTTTSEGAYALEGTSKAIQGSLEVLKKCPKATELLGKIAPWCKIVGGSFLAEKAFTELCGEQKPEGRAKSVCDLLAGTLDGVGGACELGGATAPVAIPLGIMASTFSIAGTFFESGDWLGGLLTVIIGSLTTAGITLLMKAVLTTAFKALMNTIMSAFRAIASPFLTNPITAAAAIVVIGLISMLLAEALASLIFYRGGFPAMGQPFIAREAGPELVGMIGNRSAVVNNNQIVEAVSHGVYDAFKSALCNQNPAAPPIARVYLDGKQIAVA